MNVSIYTPESSAQVFHYHLNRCVGIAAGTWNYCHNIDIFLSQPGPRMACFQIPYPYDSTVEQQIDQIYDHVDQILILGAELHPRTVDFIHRYDRSKIVWFICGMLDRPLQHSRTYPFLDWFISTVHFYKNVRPSTLYSLNFNCSKPLQFDALLGRKKPHRDIAYQYLIDHDMMDQGVVTYLNDVADQFNGHDPARWQWESKGLAGHEGVQWTVERVEYYGHRISLSQIIPIDIYNQTAYSLVCETNFDNHFVFYTEKTVKPIIARRLFVMLGNRSALARLRDLGFQTFDGIIDESYDDMELTTERHTAAMQQLEWLCQQPQAEILAKIQPRLDHNFNLMMSRDWYQQFAEPFARTFVEIDRTVGRNLNS